MSKFLKYFILVAFILISGYGNNFLTSLSFLGFITVTAFLSFLIYSYSQQYLLKLVFGITSFLFAYSLGLLFSIGELPNIYFLGRYVLLFFFVAFLIRFVKIDLWGKFENIIFVLVVISLIFSVLQLLFPNYFIPFVRFVDSFFNSENIYSTNRLYYYNCIVYTVNQNSSEFADFRNCGFAYEPGFFSLFINLGLIIEWVKSKKIISTKSIIYIIVLVSTFSTTGFIVFILSAIFLIYYFRIKTKLIYIPLVLFALFVFLNSSIGISKINRLLNDSITFSDADNKAFSNPDILVSLGRIEGFTYLFSETINTSPLFGFVRNSDSYNDNIGNPSGAGRLFYNWGLIGFLLSIFCFWASSKQFSYQIFGRRNFKWHLMFFSIFVVYLFSFPMTNTPVFFFFLFYGILTLKNYHINNYESTNCL